MNLFKEVADIKTADQLDLPTPEVEYHNIVAKPTGHQQDIHFRAAAGADQFCCNHSRHKEKARIFLTGAVIVQHSIMFFPVADLVFDYFPTVKEKIGDKMAFLQLIQDGDGLALKAGTEPCSQFLPGTVCQEDFLISSKLNLSEAKQSPKTSWTQRPRNAVSMGFFAVSDGFTLTIKLVFPMRIEY